MKRNDELEQKLWELAFGLLADDEAAALRERIAAEEQLAELDRRVREQVSLVAEASVWKAAPIPWASPDEAPPAPVPPPLPQPTSGGRTGPRLAPPAGDCRGEGPSAEVPGAPSAAGRGLGGERERRFGMSRPGSAGGRGEWPRRLASWGLGVAATLLVGLVGYGLVSPPQQPYELTDLELAEAAIATSPATAPQLVVQGPSQVTPGISNRYLVETFTQEGKAQAVPLNVTATTESGSVALDMALATDARGRGSFELAAPVNERLKTVQVMAFRNEQTAVTIPLSGAEKRYLSYVTVERPWYQAGETVRYRSLTLSRVDWEADRDLDVEFDITDPSGKPLEAAHRSSATRYGVASNEFLLPDGVLGGEYTVVVRSPDQLFPDARRSFHVHAQPARPWQVEVNWQSPPFSAGKSVVAEVVVRDGVGQPARQLPVAIAAYLDGRQLPTPNTTAATDSEGRLNLSFPLPATLGYGEGSIRLTPGADQGVPQDIPLPLLPDRVLVDCYPEGGNLVAGVENRVYFYGHDSLGRPVRLAGEVRDGAGQTVARFETQHAGRGFFRLVPQPAALYALHVTDPPGTSTDSELVVEPEAEDGGGRGGAAGLVALDCGKGVFEPGEPLAVRLRTKGAPGDLVVAVHCRGVLVGHAKVTAADFGEDGCLLSPEVDAKAGGVLRVTVFRDREPLAERLVFRKPRQLSFEFEGVSSSYAPGIDARVQLTARDETGAPAAAVVGVRTVDDALLKLIPTQAPRLTTYFWLWSDVESPDRLEDANFYVASGASDTALDLLLGTQGWRRFREVSVARLSQGLAASPGQSPLAGLAFAPQAGREGGAAAPQPAPQAPAPPDAYFALELVDVEAERPLRFDNLDKLTAQASSSAPASAPPVGRMTSVPRDVAKVWLAVIVGSLVLLGCSVLGWVLHGVSHRGISLLSGGIALAALTLGVYAWGTSDGQSDGWQLAKQAPAAPEGGLADASAEKATAGPAVLAEREEGVLTLDAESPRTQGVPATGDQPAAAGKGGVATREPRAPPSAASDELPQLRRDQLGRQEPAPGLTTGGAASPSKPAAGLPGVPQASATVASSEGQPPPAPSAKWTFVVPPRSPDMGREAVVPELSKDNVNRGMSVQPADAVPGSAGRSRLPREPSASREVDEAQADRRAAGAPQIRRLEGDRASARPDSAPGTLGGTAGRPGAPSPAEFSPRSLAVPTPAGESEQTRQQRAVEQRGAPTAGSATERQFVREFKRIRDQGGQIGTSAPRESPYWNPLLLIDASGRVDMDFKVPSAPATYQLQVEGHGSGRLGAASAEIHVRAPE